MSDTTSESNRKMLPKDQVSSLSIDEGSSGGSMGGRGSSGLKKGPWTSAEDAVLVEYVRKHGEGNWNNVQKNSGLSRCGKSCRLRWANHLRPNLKKGAFSPEEEELIIKLHATMGNKWARMAAHLPGRTDNEIKNYWNTRLKRLQRAGLPVYPSNLSFSASDENQRGQNVGNFSSIGKNYNETLQGNGLDSPDFLFDDFKMAPKFSDISVSNVLNLGFGSPSYSFINQSLDCKRLQGNENFLHMFENFSDDPSERINLTLGTSYPYDPDPLSKNISPYQGAIFGSHALTNGNFSTSRPFLGTVKSELPSLQYTESDPNFLFGYDSYDSSPQPEAVDSYIQSPPAASLQSECCSPRNSGLLQEVLQESHAMYNNGNRLSYDKSSNSSIMTPSDVVDSLGNNFSEASVWNDGDPISPLGCSASSVFKEYTTPISGSSLDELPLSRRSSGSDITLPSIEDVSTSSITERDIKPKPEFLRPDALLGSAWLLDNSHIAKDHNNMNNAVSTLLGDDCCIDRKPPPNETSYIDTGGLGLDSYPWSNMPGVHQMFENL
ncbi:uncharacterized protein A4U43_C08F32370 [Asparagus officinalis]|uniref:transcription factor GAMYB-like n=1 Tax=Asparagus officinalis TaxID=4686 RepID=UPI00098E26C9|nr:transcription factor GAMYB-like [Asparagus officinalis]XP_020241763.1 transcription factor GAMYB-like [Asparagus officinalis]ONK61671.1 uncharacterized protein A4U43_C08F32370 [Asparagus officinalis]